MNNNNNNNNGLLRDPLGGSSLLKYIIINQIKLFTNQVIYKLCNIQLKVGGINRIVKLITLYSVT